MINPNANALFGLIWPEGIARFWVRFITLLMSLS
jgi:hypothetical protein